MWFEESENEGTSKRSAINKIFKKSITKHRTINLNKLIIFLKSNNYYFNVVQYFNIEADVIIFISMKEGRKILKGVKYLLGTTNRALSCNVHNVNKMRSILILLKMIFNQLFINLEKKQQLVVDKNGQVIKFLNLVDTVIDTLSAPIDMYKNPVKNIHYKIKKYLARIKGPTAEEIDGNEDYLFDNYFNKPLNHLHSLN